MSCQTKTALSLSKDDAQLLIPLLRELVPFLEWEVRGVFFFFSTDYNANYNSEQCKADPVDVQLLIPLLRGARGVL
jgi:hypothetical protein